MAVLTKSRVEKTCEVCREPFFVHPYRSKTARFCSHACYATTVHEQKKTEKWYETMRGRTPWNKGLKGWCEEFGAGFPKGNQYQKGEKNVNWKGGVTPLHRHLRTLQAYKDWRKSIYERDSYTCQICGTQKSGVLNVDHYPKTFAQILHDNKIKSIDEAMKCSELWDTKNNRTLCVPCHRKTPTYGRPAKIITQKTR